MDPPVAFEAYVMAVVDGRGVADVFPTLGYLRGAEGDPPAPPPGPAPKPPSPSPPPKPAPAPAPPHPKGDHVLHTTLWRNVDSKDYAHYFTDLCKSACPKETQRRVAHHLNLWESLSAADSKVADDAYVVVVNNDMTFRQPEMIKPLVEEMRKNSWYMVQLKETFSAGVVATPVPGTGDPTLTVYAGGFDASLDAYIINVGGLRKVYASVIKDGGIRSSMLTEISLAEKSAGLSRMVLAGASAVVYPEYYVQVKRRLSEASSVWAVLGAWLAKWWPGAMYFLTTPLFSFMGLFDVSVVDVFILAYVLVLFILLPHSRLLWFLAGALLAAVV
nr:MAG: putative IMV protein VP55 [Equine parapoxvirus]WNT71225.1 MAG: putative IMV protein VP55 [Equine parapoxvirus]